MDPSLVLPSSSHHTTHPTPAEVAAESGRPAPAGVTQTESTTEKLLHKVEGWFDGVFGAKRSTSPSPPTSSHEVTSKSKHQRAEDESRHHASLYAAPTTDVGIGSHTSDLVKDQTHTSQPLPTSSQTSQPKIITDTRHSDTIIGDQHVTGKVTSGVAVNDAGEQLGAFSTATFIATPNIASSTSSSKPADESMPSDMSYSLPSDTSSSRPHHSTLKDMKDKILHLPDQAPIYTARHEPPDAAKVNPALLQEVIDNKGQVPIAGGEHVDVDKVEHTIVPVGHVVDQTPSTSSSNLPSSSNLSAPTKTSDLSTPVPQELLSEVKAAHGEVPSAHHVDINKVEQQHQPAGLGHVVEQPSTTASIVEKIVAMPSSLQQRLTSNEQPSTLPPGRVPQSALPNEVLRDVKSHKGVPEDVHHIDVSKVEHSAVPLGHVQPAPTLTEKLAEKAKNKYEELTGVAAKPPHEGIPPAALPEETLRDVRMHKGKPENAHHIDVKQVEAEHQSSIPVGHVVGETAPTSLKDQVLNTAAKVVHLLVAQPEPMSHPRIPHAALPNETLKEIHTARGHVPHAHHVDVAKVEKHHLEAQQIELGHEQVPPKAGLMDTLKNISGKISYAVNEIATGANQPIKTHAGIPHAALPEETLKDIKRHHGHPEHEQHVDTSLVEHRASELGHVQPGPSLLEKAVNAVKAATQPAPIQHHENIDHSSLPDQVLMDVKKTGGAKALPTAGGEHIYIENVEHNAQPAELGHVVEQPKPSLTERAMVGMQQLTNVKNKVKDTIVNATIPAPLPAREDIPESALPKETLREIKVQKGHPGNEQHVPVIEHQAAPLGHVVEGAPAESLITQDISAPTEAKPSLAERATQSLANVKNMVKDTIVNATIPAALPPREDIPESALPKETLRDIKIQKGHPVNEQHIEPIEHQFVPLGHVIPTTTKETLMSKLTHAKEAVIATLTTPFEGKTATSSLSLLASSGFPKEVLAELKSFDRSRLYHVDMAQVEGRPRGYYLGQVTNKPATPIHFPHSALGKKRLWEVRTYGRGQLKHVDLAEAERRGMASTPLGRITDCRPELKRQAEIPLAIHDARNDALSNQASQPLLSSNMAPELLTTSSKPMAVPYTAAKTTSQLPDNTSQPTGVVAWMNKPNMSSNITPVREAAPVTIPQMTTSSIPQVSSNVAPMSSQPTSDIAWMNRPHGSAMPSTLGTAPTSSAPMTSMPSTSSAAPMTTSSVPLASAAQVLPIKTTHTSNVPMTSHATGAPMTAVSEAKEAPLTSHNIMPSSTMSTSSQKPLSATHNAGVMTLPHSQKSLEMPLGTSPASRPRNLPRDEVITPQQVQGRSPLTQQRHLDSPSQPSRAISPSSRKAHEVLPNIGNKPITATDLPSLLRKLPTQAVPLVGGVTTGTTMGPSYDMPAVAPVTSNIPTNTTEEKALAPALAVQQGLQQHEKDQAATKDAKKHKETTSPPAKSTTPPEVKPVAQTQGYPVSHGNMMPLRSDVSSHQDDTLPAPTAKFMTNSASQASRTLSDVTTRPREQTYDQAEHGMIHHERHEPIINPEQGSHIASAINNNHQASDANIGRIALPSQDQSHTVAETMPLSTTHVDPFVQQTQSKLLLQSGPQGLDNPIVKQELAHLEQTGVSQTIIDIPESIQSAVDTEIPPLKHATLDKPATDPSCGDRSPSPAHPLDINPSTTSLSAIPTSHLIHDNIEPIARLQKERLHAELKRVTSIPSSILIPTRHPHQQHQAGYVSPTPITDNTEKQLSSPLPQSEHTAVAADTEFTLTSPAFAMSTQTPKNNFSTPATASATTLPLTSSNLAQHDRIVPPIEHPSGPSSPSTINTTSIPAYHP